MTEELEAALNRAGAQINGLQKRIAELEAERDALKADAERYRWLRSLMTLTKKEWGTFATSPAGQTFCVPVSYESAKQNDAIDVAIDIAALAAKGGGGNDDIR